MKRMCVYLLALLLLTMCLPGAMAEGGVFYFADPGEALGDMKLMFFGTTGMMTGETPAKEFALVDAPDGLIGIEADIDSFVASGSGVWLGGSQSKAAYYSSNIGLALYTDNGPIHAMKVTLTGAPDAPLEAIRLNAGTSGQYSEISLAHRDSIVEGAAYVMPAGEKFMLVLNPAEDYYKKHGDWMLCEVPVDMTGVAEGESIEITAALAGTTGEAVMTIEKGPLLFENTRVLAEDVKPVEPFVVYLAQGTIPLEAMRITTGSSSGGDRGYTSRLLEASELAWLDAPEGLLALRVMPDRMLEPVGYEFDYYTLYVRAADQWINEGKAGYEQQTALRAQTYVGPLVHYRLTLADVEAGKISTVSVRSLNDESGYEHGMLYLFNEDAKGYVSYENGTVLNIVGGEHLKLELGTSLPDSELRSFTYAFDVDMTGVPDGGNVMVEETKTFDAAKKPEQIPFVLEVERVGVLLEAPQIVIPSRKDAPASAPVVVEKALTFGDTMPLVSGEKIDSYVVSWETELEAKKTMVGIQQRVRAGESSGYTLHDILGWITVGMMENGDGEFVATSSPSPMDGLALKGDVRSVDISKYLKMPAPQGGTIIGYTVYVMPITSGIPEVFELRIDVTQPSAEEQAADTSVPETADDEGQNASEGTAGDSLGRIVVTESANARRGGGTDFDVVGKVRAGEAYEVLEIADNGWYGFLLDGQTAFVSPKMVKFEAE